MSPKHLETAKLLREAYSALKRIDTLDNFDLENRIHKHLMPMLIELENKNV